MPCKSFRLNSSNPSIDAKLTSSGKRINQEISEVSFCFNAV